MFYVFISIIIGVAVAILMKIIFHADWKENKAIIIIIILVFFAIFQPLKLTYAGYDIKEESYPLYMDLGQSPIENIGDDVSVWLLNKGIGRKETYPRDAVIIIPDAEKAEARITRIVKKESSIKDKILFLRGCIPLQKEEIIYLVEIYLPKELEVAI